MAVADQLLVAQEPIPAGHKIAIQEHQRGQPVIKFGWTIGQAQAAIRPGEHVHSHNLDSADRDRDSADRDREQRITIADTIHRDTVVSQPKFGSSSAPVSHQTSVSSLQNAKPLDLTFQGYIRPNGQVGTRNYLAVISNVNCSASVARMIARNFDDSVLSEYPNIDGVISFRHEGGCAMTWQGSRHRMLSRVLAAIARHPNIGGCLMVGLGCEQGNLEHLIQSQGLYQVHLPLSKPSRACNPSQAQVQAQVQPLPVLNIQDSGGTKNTIERGTAMVRELLPQVAEARRSTVSASHLILATECGGSDGYSGITANPVLGAAADLLVACGGTVILAETSEIYGAEHLLASRARHPSVAQKLYERIDWWKEYCARYGERMDNNPSIGNKQGGLTTIAEKSLGAVVKGGTTTLEAVYEYAQAVDRPGLVFMDTPGFDPASVTGMVAGGANLIAFTTGRGSCFGFKPVPCLKIASNSDLFKRLSNDMDFDAGPVIDGSDVHQMGRELLMALIDTASGKKTCSERLGIGDEEFVPWLVGPVL